MHKTHELKVVVVEDTTVVVEIRLFLIIQTSCSIVKALVAKETAMQKSSVPTAT